MLTINNLSVEFSGRPLFDGVSFIVADKDRIGLTGKNGAGKSTLLKILAGKQGIQGGSIVLTTGHTLGYLPQELIPDTHRSVLEEALTAFEEAERLEHRQEAITQALAERQDYESEAYHDLIVELNEVNDRYHLIGATNRRSETERVLHGLGFETKDFERSMAEFSSGWQMRVELAKILLQRPNILLLDEPTNHLDIESIQWLESFLQNYDGALILVSHDRTFLDAVTRRTVEIVLGRIEDYKVSYSEYEIQREERRQSQFNAYQNQQKEIADMERFIERFRYKATKARQAQSRIKALNKMDRIEVDTFDQTSIHFSFPPAPHSGKIVLEIEHLSKSYEQKNVLSDINLIVERGEKIAFIGKNGEGKSTLSRIIVGELEYEGQCRLGHQVKIGYFAQNQAALLDAEKTVFQTIDDIAVGDARPKIRQILGQFLFSAEDIDKKVKVLSGGEKNRLAMAKLLLSPSNLLVLDEPTNHLDMRSKDVLKMALLRYDGTLIVVSHDRDFLEGLTDKVYEFTQRQVRIHIGDIQAFLESRRMSSLKELELPSKSVEDKKTSDAKVVRQDRKQWESTLRKMTKRLESLEQEIATYEQKKQEMDTLLMNPSNINNSQIFVDYNRVKEHLEKAMSNWESLSLEIEAYQADQ